jgi:hypothetical protein
MVLRDAKAPMVKGDQGMMEALKEIDRMAHSEDRGAMRI